MPEERANCGDRPLQADLRQCEDLTAWGLAQEPLVKPVYFQFRRFSDASLLATSI